jgi:hypothetical protein
MGYALDWDKIQEEELKHKGYGPEDIILLNCIAKHELPPEMLEYYLTRYIHSSVMNKTENNRKLKEVLDALEGK